MINPIHNRHFISNGNLTAEAQRWLTDVQNYTVTPTMISDFNYSYDYNGNRITIQQGDGQAITDTLTYEYDRINQLTLEQRRNITSTLVSANNWSYDEVGNRTQQDNWNGSITTTTTYSYNNANQMTQEVTGGVYTYYGYDGNGNMTSKQISANYWYYAYDYENHLVSYTDPVTGTNNATYAYDALGRRTTKTVNSVAETYFYDGANIIEDYNVTGTMTACYLTPMLDQNVLISTTGASYYYFQDGLGSVRNLIDSVSSVANNYDYSAFGESYGTITETVSNRYKFTGREWDTETSQYYYRARYYTPTTGRFGGRDPIEYGGGINLYSYVTNNPANNIDPDGMTPLFKECDSVVQQIVKSDVSAKALHDALKNKCPKNFTVQCYGSEDPDCAKPGLLGTVDGMKVKICKNRVTKENVRTVLVHELVHASQFCSGFPDQDEYYSKSVGAESPTAGVSPACGEMACKEIQAAAYDGKCIKNARGNNNEFKICVKQEARKSVEASGACKKEDDVALALEKNYEICHRRCPFGWKGKRFGIKESWGEQVGPPEKKESHGEQVGPIDCLNVMPKHENR